ncbi:MAG: radical SAM protein [Salinivirgaceae bacterium]|jgi:uncharacterized protein
MKDSQDVIDIELVPQSLIDYLSKNYFILKNKEDDINLFKKHFTLTRYKSKTLRLTIAPTTDCNFRCPYCYEEGITYETMNKGTEQLVCEYINESSEDTVRIDWYGGEPLLAFDKILNICNYVKNHKKTLIIGMVTNGFLLTKERVNALLNYNIADIQITLDGIGSEHENTRIHKDGEQTFDKIIENISYILNETNIFCSIRVNVSKVKDEYQQVLQYFEEHFKGLNYKIHPGFVRDYSGLKPDLTNGNCNNGMDFKEKVSLYRKNYKFKKNINFPTLKWNDCSARSFETYVIAPDGNFYKCWEDIHNKSLAIFNIHNKGYFNDNLSNKYLFTADVLSDNRCLNCNVLPICGGGCPASRIRHADDSRFKHDCDVYKNNIEEFLTYYYENISN